MQIPNILLCFAALSRSTCAIIAAFARFVKQIFEDFENLENKKESNLNKTCCCRPAVNSYNESGQIYLYNSIARA